MPTQPREELTVAIQLRRVLFGTREDLIEALNDERERHEETANSGRTIKARQNAEGRREGLDFAIALLSDWDVDGGTVLPTKPEAKP